MIYLIEQWVKGLFLLLIGISFLEILIPKGSLSKFVNYVFSLIILASIVLPVASGFEEENLTTLGSLSYAPQETASINVQQKSEEIDRVQTKQIAAVYRQKIEFAIQESVFEEFPGISQLQVIVYIDEDVKKKSFGQIEEVEIKGRPLESEEQIKRFVSEQFQVAEKRISTEETKEEADETTGFEEQ